MTEIAPVAAVRILHTGGYSFSVDFGAAFPALATDEPAPIGEGTGPSPEQLLMAGVANCLCASLYFALTKYRHKAGGIRAEATCGITRNARGRLRMDSIAVQIRLDADAENLSAADRALAQFEDFCTVSESVRAGVPVGITIEDRAGTVVRRIRTGEDEGTSKGAPTPEDLVRLFIRHANAGDVEAIVGLYEPGAVVAAGDPVATGKEQIRRFYTDLLARKSSFDPVEPMDAIIADDLAFTITPTGAGRFSFEVARRQADGSWRFVIDQLKFKTLPRD